MQRLESIFLKELFNISHKPRVKYRLGVCPPCLCAPARQNRDMRTLEAVNDIGVDNPEIALELNAFKSSKGHDEPEVQPSALFFCEVLGTRPLSKEVERRIRFPPLLARWC